MKQPAFMVCTPRAICVARAVLRRFPLYQENRSERWAAEPPTQAVPFVDEVSGPRTAETATDLWSVAYLVRIFMSKSTSLSQ